MTANDNIRHYIGDLEATEDIDLIFKHIYDLMLANGGDGSRLNSDMVDGYHASDFAPASIVEEVEQCIHTIILGSNSYSGKQITLDVLSNYINFAQEIDDDIESEYSGANLQDALIGMNNPRSFDNRIKNTEEDIDDMEDLLSVLNDETVLNKLQQILVNNIYYIQDPDTEEQSCYLDANSVNGLSIRIVTQNEYDTEISTELKKDPYNVFIINDNIGDYKPGHYSPPSLLRASMNLEFRINTESLNIEYSIDSGKTWKKALPIVGEDESKGILYPSWFSAVQTEIQENKESNPSLIDQDNYPFLLNTEANRNALQKIWVYGLKFDEQTTITLDDAPNANGILDISNTLDNHILNWLSSNANDVSTVLNTPNANDVEYISNKISGNNEDIIEVTGNGSSIKYPSEKAVKSYVGQTNTRVSELESTTNDIKNYINTTQTLEYNSISEIKNPTGGKPSIAPPFTSHAYSGTTYKDAVYGGNANTHTYGTDVAFVEWGYDGTSPCVVFMKKNGICQISVYLKVTVYKNITTGHVEIPVLKFPPGFEPAIGGWLPNPIQASYQDSRIGLSYFSVRQINGKDYLMAHILNNNKIFMKDSKNTLIGFTWTYISKNAEV